MTPAHGEEGHECEDNREDCRAAARARGRESAQYVTCERWKGHGCDCARCQALDATTRRLGKMNSSVTTCKGCGKPMLWGKTADGKTIPLDPVPPVYRVIGRDLSGMEVARVDRLGDEVYVTHFATCPKARDFSRASK